MDYPTMKQRFLHCIAFAFVLFVGCSSPGEITQNQEQTLTYWYPSNPEVRYVFRNPFVDEIIVVREDDSWNRYANSEIYSPGGTSIVLSPPFIIPWWDVGRDRYVMIYIDYLNNSQRFARDATVVTQFLARPITSSSREVVTTVTTGFVPEYPIFAFNENSIGYYADSVLSEPDRLVLIDRSTGIEKSSIPVSACENRMIEAFNNNLMLWAIQDGYKADESVVSMDNDGDAIATTISSKNDHITCSTIKTGGASFYPPTLYDEHKQRVYYEKRIYQLPILKRNKQRIFNGIRTRALIWDRDKQILLEEQYAYGNSLTASVLQSEDITPILHSRR